MWFGKKKEIQQLNLEAPRTSTAAASAPAANRSIPASYLDPAKLAAVNQRAQEILNSGDGTAERVRTGNLAAPCRQVHAPRL